MVSSCARGGLYLIFGRVSSLSGLPRIEINGLPREEVKLPSLEIFTRCVDMALRDIV